jgi:hypothetical protein
VREGVAKSDARRRGFDEFAGVRAIKHAGLRSHDGSSLYTGGERKEVESLRVKVERKNKRQCRDTPRNLESKGRESRSSSRLAVFQAQFE